MASGRKIQIKGFSVKKDGTLVKSQRHLDASARIRQKKSRKTRVVRRGTA